MKDKLLVSVIPIWNIQKFGCLTFLCKLVSLIKKDLDSWLVNFKNI